MMSVKLKNSILKTAIVFFLINIFSSCSSKIFVSGTFQQTLIKIDGDLTEWNRPLRFGSNGGQAQYNVTNDGQNIYIAIETKDAATVLKILRNGINIYFDVDGGKSKKMGLAFPLPNSIVVNASSSESDKVTMLESLLVQANSFNTTGFINVDNRLHDVINKSGIKVAIKQETISSLSYEAAVPLKYIYNNTATAKKAQNNISVGIIINGIKGASNNRNSNNSFGNTSGMRMGGHGGRSGNYSRNPSNQNSYNSPDKSAINKEDANWYYFKLANK